MDKTATLQALAEHVLDHGLNSASLRPLAKAAGTSDRMLIYHFGSKDGLITELLRFISAGVETELDRALPEEPAATIQEYIGNVLTAVSSPAIGRSLGVWLDILSAAAQGAPAHRQIGQEIIATYHGWLERRLPEKTENSREVASLMLLVIEGGVVLRAVGEDARIAEGLSALLTRL